MVFKELVKGLDYATSFGGYLSSGSTRFLRFATSNAFTLIVDILLLVTLVQYLFIDPVLGAGISFTISTSLSYFINRKWSFKGTITHALKGYLLFLTFGIFGITLTMFLMWVFIDVLIVQYILARIIVAGIEGIFSFTVNSLFTFKMPHHKKEGQEIHKTLKLEKKHF
ncbi:GtrA family protein [archaeon]|jgi:putative flippase GtrA|nr:GtrA family protein [archaeon]MBT4241596.1 GtrA family protein [archaeon]MBT4417991.1 GtrA family protein [archaeon]